MKTVVHTKRAKDKALHIETEGCIVNIRVGLTSDAGQEVTNISVRPDQYAGEPHWYLVDEKGNRIEHLGFRVVRETDKEFESRRAYERMLWQPIASLEVSKALKMAKTDVLALLTFECEDKGLKGIIYTLEIERIREKGHTAFYLSSTPDFMSRGDFGVSSTIADVIKYVQSRLSAYGVSFIGYHSALDPVSDLQEELKINEADPLS